MNKRQSAISLIIGLAILGLFSILIRNPFVLIKAILTLVVISAILFFLIRLFIHNNHSSEEMRKYKQALKQSKLRYEKNNQKKQKRKRPSYLRVIDGNKGKNKDQATFK